MDAVHPGLLLGAPLDHEWGVLAQEASGIEALGRHCTSNQMPQGMKLWEWRHLGEIFWEGFEKAYSPSLHQVLPEEFDILHVAKLV